jgi:hypothetical protein
MKKLFLLFALFLPALGFAQNYTIDWYKIAGGGVMNSTNGPYSLSGTIGQVDASGALTNGNYSVTGGFWAIYAVQTSGAPLLNIIFTNNQAVVSWPSSVTGWTLQTNSSVTTTNWTNYAGAVVNNTVTNSSPKGTLYFRLFQP